MARQYKQKGGEAEGGEGLGIVIIFTIYELHIKSLKGHEVQIYYMLLR